MAFTRFTLDSSMASLWRVTFHNPSINLIDSVMLGELGELFAEVESNEGPVEILLGGEDFDGALAERYGYVNRAIPDDEFENFVDRFARRVGTFDRQALADIQRFVNNVSRPPDDEFPPQMDAFWRAVARPAL